MSTNTSSMSTPPVLVKDWKAFTEWVSDGGYSESEMNRLDYRSLVLQENYLEEGRAQALELVGQNGLELEHLNIDMRTPLVCLAAVAQNSQAIKFMDAEQIRLMQEYDAAQRQGSSEIEPQIDAVWAKAKPAMLAKLTAVGEHVQQALSSSNGADKFDFSFEPPTASDDPGSVSDERYVMADVVVTDAEDENVLALNLAFMLLEQDEDDGAAGQEGFCVRLNFVGYNSLDMGGYAPHACTSSAFTNDVDEIMNRIDALDPREMAAHVMRCLENETLLAELSTACAQAPRPAP